MSGMSAVSGVGRSMNSYVPVNRSIQAEGKVGETSDYWKTAYKLQEQSFRDMSRCSSPVDRLCVRRANRPLKSHLSSLGLLWEAAKGTAISLYHWIF